MKVAARDRGIGIEGNWLMELNGLPYKAREFMNRQIKESNERY